ncbi:GIY-YIG nuclease family protein [Rhodohalobacter sp. 8-1]
MYYVYILRSVNEDWQYFGYTSELKHRLNDHNQGKVKSTKEHHPLR